MEWFWYIIASLAAGVGTGLVGLSAATVMVPMLIVLCPYFTGETGVYQATAVALASDILGSAVAAYTYAKHKYSAPSTSYLIKSTLPITESSLLASMGIILDLCEFVPSFEEFLFPEEINSTVSSLSQEA